MSAQMLEASTSGVATVLRLERDAWSMGKLRRQATNEYALHPWPQAAKQEGDKISKKFLPGM